MKKWLGLAICWAALSGCATHRSLMKPIQADLEMGQCQSALEKLQKQSEIESDDQLLYLMEYGSALQICGDYEKSSQIFIQADKLSEQIDYLSLSRATAATLLNEEMLQFKGDKFEKLFINVLAALNYLELGQQDSAMVEVRRINEKIRKFSEEEKRSYELNSFASYLAGLIYESNRQFDDACIAYQESYRIDSSYRVIVGDMLTACWRAKRLSEYSQLVKSVNATADEIKFSKRPFKKNKELVLLYLQGWGPQKVNDRQRASFARLAPVPSLTQTVLVDSTEPGMTPTVSQIVYDVEKAAIQTLEADYSALAARRLGARVAKEVVADQVRQKDNALGNLAWLVMVASERADLRNWALLPQTIQVVRVNTEKPAVLNITGKNNSQTMTESLGQIDPQKNPSKKIYIMRSLK